MLPVGLQGGRRLRSIALLVVVARCLPASTEEVCPGWVGIDGEVEAGICRWPAAPGRPVADQIGSDGSDGVRGGIEELHQWQKRAGGEDRNHENDRNDGGEPAGPQQREQEQEKFISRDSKPVERGIEMV